MHSFNYLYQSMLNVYELYYKELITIEELEYMVMSLNRDVKGLVNLYIRYASEKLMYEKAYGLDPDFYKKEKEYMDRRMAKYFNITVEDIR